MKKMKLKQTGKEVKIGDTLVTVVEVCGIPIPLVEIEVNKSTLPVLIKQGIVVTEEGSDFDIDGYFERALDRIASRIGWSKENLERYLNNLYKISRVAVFDIVLHEIAVMLDEKYPNHIKNSKEIWVISKVDGEIHRLEDPKKIKSFKHFAAFRCLKDALIAKEVMGSALKDLYGK